MAFWSLFYLFTEVVLVISLKLSEGFTSILSQQIMIGSYQKIVSESGAREASGTFELRIQAPWRPTSPPIILPPVPNPRCVTHANVCFNTELSTGFTYNHQLSLN